MTPTLEHAMLFPKRPLAMALILVMVPGLAAAATPPSLCAAGEQVAFSCPIAGSRKTVSLCLQPGSSGPPAARYVFGTASHPELIYPAGGAGQANFRSSHLSYAGATGGNAYSFVNGDVKYIVFQVSGTGLDDAGVLVQHVGQVRASAELDCRANTAARALNGDAFNRMKAWKPDPDLDGHSLPHP